MKIRDGFVSNSSSSSFILAFDPLPYNSPTMLRNSIAEKLGVPAGHPLKPLVDDMLEEITPSQRDYDKAWSTIEDVMKYENTEDEEEVRDWHEKECEFIDRGWRVITGSWADDESGMERFLCETDLNFKTDGMEMIHDGGY